MSFRYALVFCPVAFGMGIVLWNQTRFALSGSQAVTAQTSVLPSSPQLPRSGGVIGLNDVAASISAETGESHSKALEIADRITRENLQLSAEEVREMMGFISGPRPQHLSEGEWHHRVNSILNALRAQNDTPQGLTDFLIRTALRREDPVLSLYALQHLSLWLPCEVDEEKQKAIQDLFAGLMLNPGEPTAGTAVLMSSDLERKNVHGFDAAHIDQAALRLVTDKNAPQDVRVSALHACTDRQLVAVLSDARRIAADRTEISTLRKAAIYAIGRLGENSDLPLLSEISEESRHLAAATTPATERIRARISKP